MAVLKPSPVSTRSFTRTNTREFVADLSDLGPDFRLERVYDDACDVGLTLVSHTTGAEIVFGVEREDRDGEGELRFYELLPVSRHDRSLGFSVRLYND